MSRSIGVAPKPREPQIGFVHVKGELLAAHPLRDGRSVSLPRLIRALAADGKGHVRYRAGVHVARWFAAWTFILTAAERRTLEAMADAAVAGRMAS